MPFKTNTICINRCYYSVHVMSYPLQIFCTHDSSCRMLHADNSATNSAPLFHLSVSTVWADVATTLSRDLFASLVAFHCSLHTLNVGPFDRTSQFTLHISGVRKTNSNLFFHQLMP